jgi:hypothetical protein
MSFNGMIVPSADWIASHLCAQSILEMRRERHETKNTTHFWASWTRSGAEFRTALSGGADRSARMLMGNYL